jgi:hypothetical protein
MNTPVTIAMQKLHSVEVVSLIKITMSRGKGTEQDIARQVIQYWNYNNELVFEVDPLNDD